LNNALKVKQALLDGMRASGTATAAQIKREESGVRKLAEALEVQKSAAVKARAALNAMGVTGKARGLPCVRAAHMQQFNRPRGVKANGPATAW
jgi:hypothetical protein